MSYLQHWWPQWYFFTHSNLGSFNSDKSQISMLFNCPILSFSCFHFFFSPFCFNVNSCHSSINKDTPGKYCLLDQGTEVETIVRLTQPRLHVPLICNYNPVNKKISKNQINCMLNSLVLSFSVPLNAIQIIKCP